MYSLVSVNSAFLKGSVIQTKRTKFTNVRVCKHNARSRNIVCSSVMPTKNLPQIAEKLNGRLAMLGFLAGSGYEQVYGMNYLDQLQETWAFLAVMVGVISFATLKTRNMEVDEKAPFTTNLELLNGRMAMLGLLCKFIYDSGVVV